MKTTLIFSNNVLTRTMRRLVGENRVTRLLAASVGALITLCSTGNAAAQTAIVTPVGYGTSADMTANLLDRNLTLAQRQVVHAQNFQQLPLATRPIYLRVVAFDEGFMIATSGPSLSTTELIDYLVESPQNAWPDDWEMPWLVAKHKDAVKNAMQNLNLLILGQIANNATLLEAMDRGAIDSFFDIWPELGIVDDTLNGI